MNETDRFIVIATIKILRQLTSDTLLENIGFDADYADTDTVLNVIHKLEYLAYEERAPLTPMPVVCEWINADLESPLDSEVVIGWLKGDDGVTAYPLFVKHVWGGWYATETGDNVSLLGGRITHWMPLPPEPQ